MVTPSESPAMPQQTQADIMRRLRRLEGQVRGVQRMVQEGRDCQEVLDQIAAIEAAARSLGGLVLEHYVLSCLDGWPAELTPAEVQARVRHAVQQVVR